MLVFHLHLEGHCRNLRYKFIPVLVEPLLTIIAHGNADSEWEFRVSKNIIGCRSNIIIHSINGICKIKIFYKEQWRKIKKFGEPPSYDVVSEAVKKNLQFNAEKRKDCKGAVWIILMEDEFQSCCTLSDKDKLMINEYNLCKAAYEGDSLKINHLLSLGTSVDAEETNSLHNKTHQTPLRIAVECSHEDCVRLLLNHGANPNARDFYGLTPLMIAAFKSDLNSLKSLLSFGAEVNFATTRRSPNVYPWRTFPPATTALHLAATSGSVECVRELIQCGANCSNLDNDGRTSLYIATKLGFSECVLAHIESSTSHDFLSFPAQHTLDTPLHLAIDQQLEECIQALVHRGADVCIKNKFKCSPLSLALEIAADFERNVKLLRTILMEGHNLDVTQIFLTSYPTQDFICANILRPGAIKPFPDRCGNHMGRRPQLVKFLLAYGIKAGTYLQDYLKILEHELHAPDEEFGLLQRIVDIFQPTRNSNNLSLSMPEEFAVDSNRRKIFTRALLDHLRNISPPLNASKERLRELYLTSDEPIVSKGLRIFWPPERTISELHAETYIAFHLSKGPDASYLSYEELFSQVCQLWGRWCVYLKQKWYHDTRKNPRSLKDSCRYVVRKSLDGNHMARNLKKLNIPNELKSFLLFFEDTD